MKRKREKREKRKMVVLKRVLGKKEEEGEKELSIGEGLFSVPFPTNQKLNAEFEDFNQSETRADKRGF